MIDAAGFISVSTKLSVDAATSRLEAAIAARGMTLFAKVDHGEGARQAGMELRPTILFMFGAAKGGTPLMQANQVVGVDLPLKALIWQDEQGVVSIGYVDPRWIADLRGLGPEPKAIAGKLQAMLADLVGGVAA
jgi:uncharacterized protein (DUF302 family)